MDTHSSRTAAATPPGRDYAVFDTDGRQIIGPFPSLRAALAAIPPSVASEYKALPVDGDHLEPLLPGGRFGPAMRYGALRLLGTANGARWHRVCGGRAETLHKATYRARRS